MISYKKINMVDLSLDDEQLKYKGDNLLLKTPIIYVNRDDNKFLMKINKMSKPHDTFLNICGYINTLHSTKKKECDLINNDCIVAFSTNESRFFNKDRNIISSMSFKKETKVICSLYCNKGKLIISECLIIENIEGF